MPSGDQALQQAFDDAGDAFRVKLVELNVDLNAGDLQIGAVEIKDAASDARAEVGPSTAIAEADNALATHDPAVGTSLDAEAAAGNGSAIAILKRIRTLLSGTLTARHPASTSPVSGEFAPGVTVNGTAFPSVPASLVRLKARAANAGKVYVGVAGVNVTKADGTTDTTSGFELEAGDDTGWLPIDNLNRLKGIGDNAADSVTYLVLP